MKEATLLKNGDVVCFGVNLATNEFYYTFNASENKAVLKRVETETTPKLIVSIPRALLERAGNKTPSTTTSSKNQAATSSALTDTPQYNSTSSSRKKSRSKTLDIDAVLFGSQKSETGHDSVSKAIFGDDDCQPRSKVKQGMGATDILIQAAQDKMEQEKSHLLSNIEALKSELAAKEKLLVTRDESEKVAESVLKENRDMLSSMQEEFTCVICQELFINAYTLPCAHTFCEWCIKEWMQSKKKKDCPICRKSIASEPVHSLVMDNAISKLVEKLTQEERDAREEVTKLHSNSLKTLTAMSSGASVAGVSSRGRRGPRMRGGSLRRRGGRRGRGRRPAQEERAVEVMATFRAGVTVNQAAPVIYIGGGGGGSNGPIVISPVHGVDRRPPNSPIVISDEEEQTSPDSSAVESSSSSSDTSFEEIPGAYYGGYGRCYSCGEKKRNTRECLSFACLFPPPPPRSARSLGPWLSIYVTDHAHALNFHYIHTYKVFSIDQIMHPFVHHFVFTGFVCIIL